MNIRTLPASIRPFDRFVLVSCRAEIAKQAGIDVESLLEHGIPVHCYTVAVTLKLRCGANLFFPRAFLVRDSEKILVLTQNTGYFFFSNHTLAGFDLGQPSDAGAVPAGAHPAGIPERRRKRPSNEDAIVLPFARPDRSAAVPQAAPLAPKSIDKPRKRAPRVGMPAKSRKERLSAVAAVLPFPGSHHGKTP